MSATFDRAQFAELARRLGAVKHKSASEILGELGGTLLRYLFQMTVPFGKHPISERSLEQRKLGEGAIQRDFRKAFKPLTPSTVNEITHNVSPSAAKWIKQYARQGLIGKLNALLKRLGFSSRVQVIRFLNKETARSAISFLRRPHGVKQKYLVMDAASIKKELASAIADVGKAKAGWLTSVTGHFKRIPSWVPAWVRKHGPQPGGYTDRRDGPVNPYVEFRNMTRGAAAEDIDTVQAAYRTLQITMRKQIEAILNRNIRQSNRK